MKPKLFILIACIAFVRTPLLAEIPVKIETDKTKEPISPYIYGQFIEHLGRCIYGGIWAEMLEDRKFFYPIKDDFNPWAKATDRNWGSGPFPYLSGSPWKVIGPARTVTMDAANPHVGKHTPVIRLPGDGTTAGISQDGLGVLKGKGYVGHVVLAGDSSAAPVHVRLVLSDGAVLAQQIKKLGGEFHSYPIKFTAPSASENVHIEIVSQGKGAFKIGTLSLMPADNIKGWRRDVVALLKELDAPIYRWPGGNFVSGYNWRDGIGPRDRRPPRKNPAWKGIEHNDVGLHEYMDLMALIGAEPFIAVNTGLGTVEEVAAEVEYCNGSATTAMGKLRAQNGHSKPFDVKWWAVGNEMYGSWQLGHMPLAEYVKKHNRVAEAMWKVDPKAQLVGVGAVGKWSQTMLTVCREHLNLLSEHIYCKEKTNVLDHVRQLSDQIKRVADAHRRYRRELPELAGKDIRLAMDEWNYWYGQYLYGELGVRYFLKDALGVGMGLHEYFRNSDLYFMANYAQTVNVIGAIKTTPTASAFETTGLALKLYRREFGTIPIEVSGSTGHLDIAAAWTSDKKAVTVAIVNPQAGAEQVVVDLGPVTVGAKAKRWLLTGAGPQSYNEPGKTPNVVIQEERTTIKGGLLAVPPFSVVLYRLDAR